MADGVKNDEEHCALPPLKRKPDSYLLDPADDQPKKSKAEIETPLTGVEPPIASEVQEDEDSGEMNSDGEAEIDRKSKGMFTRDDKGKGKMVEEEEGDSDDEIVGDGEEEDDDDDSSDDEDVSGYEDDDSDLWDDPLTEVDLDNILPSRTRRRAASNGGIILGKGNGN